MHLAPIRRTLGQTLLPDFLPKLAMQQCRRFFQVEGCHMPYKILAMTYEPLHVVSFHARLGRSFSQTLRHTLH